MDFKGLVKGEAATAVYFGHRLIAAEVIVNIPALWDDPGFEAAAEDYRTRGELSAGAVQYDHAERGCANQEIPLKADIAQCSRHVSKVPITDLVSSN
jgi:hypothetical protein